MKVVHLSSSDGGGGAAVAAFRLHSGLRGIGLNSRMIVGKKLTTDPLVSSPVSDFSRAWSERVDRLPRRLLRTANQTHISSGWAGTKAWKSANRENPDLVHLHWIGKGFLRIEDVARLNAPLAWSLHDMWTFAGGEHYVDSCARFRDGYLRQNRPAFERGFDLNRWVWERKQRAWAAIPHLTLFCVSQWLAQRARESALFRDRPVKVLHNALDPAVFSPRDKRDARALVGLPLGRRLVLFGAIDATTDKRKGFDLLTGAIGELCHRGRDFDLVVFGNEPVRAAERLAVGCPLHYLGKITDERRLAAAYAACDVMVVPSREEAFGQTALEALACATPVVAFQVGGLPEIVEHNLSGYLARPLDVRDLANGIAAMMAPADPGRPFAFGAAGRARVEREFTLEFQARRCAAFYEEILSRTPRQPRAAQT